MNGNDPALFALWLITLGGWLTLPAFVTIDWSWPHDLGTWAGTVCGLLFLLTAPVWLRVSGRRRHLPLHPQHTIKTGDDDE